jgi:membrane associated rhomboid family serine protease
MPGLRGPRKDEAITKRAKFTLQLQYNSPVILTFFLLSLLVLFLGQWTNGWTTMHLFCVYRSSFKDPLFYVRLFGHVLGHASWDHFLNNMLLLLVIGPPMEEKYGSIPLLEGIVFTALVSGVLQCALFPRTALLGASGIVFMLIMLASLSGFSGGIPVTMLLVAALYLGQQVYDIVFVHDNVANFMHIVGGICGTGFGYFYALRPQKRRKASGAKLGLKFEKTSRHRSR